MHLECAVLVVAGTALAPQPVSCARIASSGKFSQGVENSPPNNALPVLRLGTGKWHRQLNFPDTVICVGVLKIATLDCLTLI
jgi:hypothetical protein